jgi:hypothetical protein
LVTFTKHCKEYSRKTPEIVKNFGRLAQSISGDVFNCTVETKTNRKHKNKKKEECDAEIFERALNMIFSRTSMSCMEDINVLIQVIQKLIKTIREKDDEIEKQSTDFEMYKNNVDEKERKKCRSKDQEAKEEAAGIKDQ